MHIYAWSPWIFLGLPGFAILNAHNHEVSFCSPEGDSLTGILMIPDNPLWWRENLVRE